VTSPGRHQADDAFPYLGGQISALQQRIGTANTPGNLDGLLARHILRRSPDLAWQVDPMSGSWLKDNAHRLEETSAFAAVGYGLAARPSVGGDVKPRVCAGLRRLMQRDPFPGDRISFLHDIRILFGVRLAAESVKAELPEALTWLQGTLADPRLQAADRFHELAQHHVYAELAGKPTPLENLQSLISGSDLAMALWMISRGTARVIDATTDMRALQQLVMRAVMSSNALDLDVPRSALLLWAVDDVIESSIDQMVLSRSHVGLVLRRFQAAMRRWRWDNDDVKRPVRWEVRSEREVQDILWLMLRSTFDEVIDEETLPKFGHSSYRADFGIPHLGVLVEAKYVYKSKDFKKIEDEIMIDSIAYLKKTDRYKEIVVFIYDESASVEHHDLTRRMLLELNGVSDVIIVSRPGILSTSSRLVTKRITRTSKESALHP
jgi:DpnII restriction endonuclease